MIFPTFVSLSRKYSTLCLFTLVRIERHFPFVMRSLPKQVLLKQMHLRILQVKIKKICLGPYTHFLKRITQFRSSRLEVFCIKGVLSNFAKFTGKHLYLYHLFSCEFCEISKNTFFYRTPPVAASDSFS